MKQKTTAKTKSDPKSKAAAQPSEIRKHYFLDRYVIIAPKRDLRPNAHETEPAHTTETAESIPIEQDRSILEIKGPDGQWAVKVVNNKFPALSLDNPKAYGKQEVVVETPDHNVEFSCLPLTQIERVFEAWISRAETLRQLPGIRYVSIFKNDGPRAGASIAHAHSQIAALPMIPPHLASEAEQVQAYRIEHDTCPHCDVISWERRQKVRVVYEDKHILAIAPYAERYPFGLWVLPTQHRQRFAQLSLDERHSFATVLKQITAKLDASHISFNLFLHDSLSDYDQHFVLQVQPRSTVWAGLEVSTGLVINPVPPEFAARWYRGRE